MCVNPPDIDGDSLNYFPQVAIDYNYSSKTVNANNKNVEIDFESAGEFENAKKTKGTKTKKMHL